MFNATRSTTCPENGFARSAVGKSTCVCGPSAAPTPNSEKPFRRKLSSLKPSAPPIEKLALPPKEKISVPATLTFMDAPEIATNTWPVGRFVNATVPPISMKLATLIVTEPTNLVISSTDGKFTVTLRAGPLVLGIVKVRVTTVPVVLMSTTAVPCTVNPSTPIKAMSPSACSAYLPPALMNPTFAFVSATPVAAGFSTPLDNS